MRLLLIACLIFTVLGSPWAKSLNETGTSFNLKQANQQFDRINLKLSIQNLDAHDLENAISTFSLLTAQAEQSMEDIQKRLNNIDLLIKQNSANKDSKENSSESVDLVYLDKQRKELSDQQAQYRLFIIRAKEAIEAYKAAIAQMKQEAALTRGLPLWESISQAIQAPSDIHWLDLFKDTSKLPSPLFLSLFLSIAFLCATIILRKLRRSRFARRYLQIKKIQVSHLLILGIGFSSAALWAYLGLTIKEPMDNDILLMISKTFFSYFALLAIILFVFRIKQLQALFYGYSFDHRFFQAFFVSALSLYMLALLGQLLSSHFNTHSPLWQVDLSSFEFGVLMISAYFVHRFCYLHRHVPFIRRHHHLIRSLSLGLLLSFAIIDALGYQTLARHLTFSGFITLLIVFISILITQSINKLYLFLYQQSNYKNLIIKHFGYRPDQTFTEFLILKIILELMVIATSIYLIGQSWDFATDFISSLYDQLLNGLHIASMVLYPTRILTGVVVFCLLYLLFRAISTSISSHQQFEDEEETQVAVASILTYIGFGIAIISGFLVAGFDFTGLAIIAGALSVGIGLGLQSIVNNFVSGLILLIEKPIRPGDRIQVDGIEGFVKKIRVRSTQIVTSAREDIVVPNSDLITHRVTNYMLSDKYCRLHCDIGVAYGSDTQVVHDVLLNIALQHEEVIKIGRNKPTVLFVSFGDSSLVFQLSCLIKDVNKKSVVQSELNYAIEKAFREHQIEMPYPQREIHLKLAELTAISTKISEE
jgi:potassium efflux system protein